MGKSFSISLLVCHHQILWQESPLGCFLTQIFPSLFNGVHVRGQKVLTGTKTSGKKLSLSIKQ
ncbi:CLUMA_CG010189, isoform A [Clunio marinus]|uniref:CLUMA_CG010189, isoform A n=1 Tax=Clunio marinus TaxID=568069 RepID=A0A1J1I8A3_9DIPT|nr:CLUMA_CG010189, isoform A [Clunio marinus]